MSTAVSRAVISDSTPTSLMGDYLTEQELGKELHRSVRTLIRWRAKRFGPAATILGQQVYYHRETVREWLRSLEQKPRRRRSRGQK